METNVIQTFVHEEFGKIRTIKINGEAWFVGKDAATALEYTDTDQAIRVNVDDRDKQMINAKILRQMASECNPVQDTGNPLPNTGFEFDSPRGLMFINVSGLFSLILNSRMKKAKEFRHWITSVVLPELYSKGSYTMPNAALSDKMSEGAREKVNFLMRCAEMTNLDRLRNQFLRDAGELITGKNYR